MSELELAPSVAIDQDVFEDILKRIVGLGDAADKLLDIVGHLAREFTAGDLDAALTLIRGGLDDQEGSE